MLQLCAGCEEEVTRVMSVWEKWRRRILWGKDADYVTVVFTQQEVRKPMVQMRKVREGTP